MDEEQIEKAVLAYLKKKGYRQAEQALQEEHLRSAHNPSAKTDPDIANQILRYSKSDTVPALYKEAYGKLRNWVHSSLDLYKNELLRILYPVFLHCFMDVVAKGFPQEARTFFQTFREDHEALHLRDLQILQGILSSEHLQEMELARSLRENKVNIKMCQYSFDLLLQYLHNTDSSLMLGIVNERINLQVSSGQPTSWSEEDMGSLLGKPQEAVNEVNTKEIRWGMLEDSLEEKLEKELATEAEKAEAEVKEGEGVDVKKKTGEAGKSKKMKKDKLTGATGKGLKTETTTVTIVPRVKSELVMPTLSEETERQALEDLRNRARLSSTALPSVSFYSFVNTHSSLNCASISLDGAMVVGGFADSSLKVWDMAKLGEQQSSFASGTGNGIGSTSIEIKEAAPDSGKPPYTLLKGHAGPVYSANFSPDGDYILSASNDCTVRLWSLPLVANLVCYKGHNYPVWDVQFSPVGHYFASASHDRTARVWSMDRVQPLRIMAGHFSDVDCVQWHVNCNYIATGSSDKTVRLWDVATGECMRLFTGHRGMVTSLAMSPDGRYMASGDEDGAIMMWDLGSGQSISPLMGHTACVWTLAFSCEGSLLASGSADNTVRIWDVSASSKMPRGEEKNVRKHFVLISPELEAKLVESQFDAIKKQWKAQILPPIHPQAVRVRKIAKDVIQAVIEGTRIEEQAHVLEEGDSDKVVWEDHADTPVSTQLEGHDEVLDNGWVDETRKKGLKEGTKPFVEHLKPAKWEVIVVDKDLVNAFCLPGGKIVVFTGLLKRFPSDAEIATVLGHEVAHVVARHSAERLTQHLFLTLVELFILAFFYAPDLVRSAATLFLELPFSRSQELEADHIGLLLMAAAGYDPRVAPQLYEKLGELSGSSDLLQYVTTHPSGTKRGQRLRKTGTMEQAVNIYLEKAEGKTAEGFL